MLNKNTILLAVLLPGLAVLAGCNDRDGDNAATTAAAATAEADSKPADNMPAGDMPAGDMAGHDMPGHDMATMGAELSFAEMDKNSDGSVTHDEMSDTDMLHQHFAVADSNGDNMLSEAEIVKHRADMAAAPAK